jgi:hypothetical protein
MLNKIIFAGIVALSGCATTTNNIPEGMKVATASQVEKCELLGDVHGVSMLYGAFAESALGKARQQAFQQARSMNANTVVWLPFEMEKGSTSVHGNAYKCS